jgi:hypothetical protein
MLLMFAAVRAELLEFQPFGCGSLVFGLAVIAVLTLTALELNDFSGHFTFSPLICS